MNEVAQRPTLVKKWERVPFNDLSIQWSEIDADVRHDYENIFAESAFCLGPYVEKFEHEFANYLGARHAIGVNSGTSALHLAVLAAGIGAGDENSGAGTHFHRNCLERAIRGGHTGLLRRRRTQRNDRSH